ncbi:MAG: thiol reductant ABC exporter subunit CydD [Alkalimonas sp.]|nr:thiol reductant ABC exporter subunit CydD [Alkalimonas sp.]
MSDAEKQAASSPASIASGAALLKLLAKQQKRRLQLAVACGMLATAALIVQWLGIAWLLQQGIMAGQQWSEALSMPLLAVIVLALLCRVVALWAQERLAGQASIQLRLTLRQGLLQHWQQGCGYQLMQQSPAAAASQWMEDIEAMDGYFSRYWPQQYLTVLSPLLILGVVASLNWLTALLLLLAAPLIPLFMVLVGLGAEQLNQRHQQVRQRLAGHFLDRIKHLTMLRRFSALQSAEQEVAERSQHFRRVLMKTLRIAFLSSAVLEFFTSVAIASVAIYIGFALFGAINWGPAEGITLFSGLAILLLAPEFFQPLRNFAQFYHDRAAAEAAAQQLAPQLTANSLTMPQMTDEPTDSSLVNQSKLQLSGVSIGYPGQPALQQGITVELNRGQCWLIHGSSGVGKSTLLHTLAGLVPVQAGCMAFNERPLAEQAVAYLPQTPWLVQGSWADNLRLLAPAATEPQMLVVLEQLELAELIEHRLDGLQRPITEQGQGLSGGQLQRLALARVLLAPTPVVLLDEPTASLDPISRDIVIRTLQHLKPSVILVMVSHDPALQALADSQLALTESGGGHGEH